MSDGFNNKSNKQSELKKIIKDLHSGVSFEKVKKEFEKIIKNVSAEEIAEMEQALSNEGFPPLEIQKLCDVHVAVFEKSLNKQKKEHRIPGHPVHTFQMENKEAKRIISSFKKVNKKILKKKNDKEFINEYEKLFIKLKEIIIHYTRKENQLFPLLEKSGFTGPSKVMWGKHDEIRNIFKRIEGKIKNQNWQDVQKEINELFTPIKKMIFMEERILFPTALRKLDDNSWIEIKKGEKDIGYAWITPSNLWDASLVKNLKMKKEKELPKTQSEIINGEKTIKLEEGKLTEEQINLLLKSLPFDVTFVDENDKVCYYSATDDRVFPRSPAIIDREVQNCHPPKSVHIVNKIIESFKNKTKNVAEFWISLNNRMIHIRYFPVYNKKGEYKGVIEVSQDITEVQKLTGQKRLLDWE